MSTNSLWGFLSPVHITEQRPGGVAEVTAGEAAEQQTNPTLLLQNRTVRKLQCGRKGNSDCLAHKFNAARFTGVFPGANLLQTGPGPPLLLKVTAGWATGALGSPVSRSEEVRSSLPFSLLLRRHLGPHGGQRPGPGFCGGPGLPRGSPPAGRQECPPQRWVLPKHFTETLPNAHLRDDSGIPNVNGSGEKRKEGKPHHGQPPLAGVLPMERGVPRHPPHVVLRAQGSRHRMAHESLPPGSHQGNV